MSKADPSKSRRVVKKYDVFGKPYWEVQVRGMFGWKNEFPAFDCFPATIFYSEADAMKVFRQLIDGETKIGVEEVVATFDGHVVEA